MANVRCKEDNVLAAVFLFMFVLHVANALKCYTCQQARFGNEKEHHTRKERYQYQKWNDEITRNVSLEGPHEPPVPLCNSEDDLELTDCARVVTLCGSNPCDICVYDETIYHWGVMVIMGCNNLEQLNSQSPIMPCETFGTRYFLGERIYKKICYCDTDFCSAKDGRGAIASNAVFTNVNASIVYLLAMLALNDIFKLQ